MSEQPGKAAGTAEPTESPFNHRKPWRLSKHAANRIVDADGVPLAVAAQNARAETNPVSEAIARHIVACVNFCSELDSDLLEALSGGEFKITCQRIAPALAAELADNLKQFHADHADKPVAILTGGAI